MLPLLSMVMILDLHIAVKGDLREPVSFLLEVLFLQRTLTLSVCPSLRILMALAGGLFLRSFRFDTAKDSLLDFRLSLCIFLTVPLFIYKIPLTEL